MSYLKANAISYSYWCWNSDSGDTGGILDNDWKTVDQAKMDILSAYQWPLLGQAPSAQTSPNGDVAGAFRWP